METGQGDVLNHRPLYNLDCIENGMAQLSQRWENRLVGEKLNIAKEYVGGNLCVIINIDKAGLREAVDGKALPLAKTLNVVVQDNLQDFALSVPHDKLLNLRYPKDGCDNGVFIKVIQTVENVQEVTVASGERLKRLKHVFDGYGGCFHSLATGFKTGPIVSGGEFEVTVLCAAVSPNSLPG